ncbi:uncharacterized protein (TIGR02687 family) [Aneurinibacillus soli]|uniref:PglZ domain protein n=1 Tax=Aneurinibacillus soli TaxID=1500254 RepID=A0A0U5BDP0_9BACL|nr:BREX-1 system phosphatase PglZ type A [Aneurinibacillus soli]PYE61917.1 uncharacterized protein (TIGR02687 family) [Aneurinibacillus soli]BAU29734.1 PglZ domain protein [Aneurinibacillus soli]
MEIIMELQKRFEALPKSGQGRQIVFWYDTVPNRELEPIQEAMTEFGVQVWELHENNAFATKYQLEVNDPDTPYLIYARFPRPDDIDNSLLDIVLYSETFEADDIAMLMHRYHVEQLSVRDLFAQYRAFFNDKRRAQKLENLLQGNPNQEQVILGMLAVLSGSPSATMPTIIKHILLRGLDEEKNPVYQDISKFFSTDILWQHVRAYFGIEQEEISLQTLFQTFVYAHFSSEIDFDLPVQFPYRYPSRLQNTCRILLEDWLKGTEKETVVLEEYLADVEAKWSIREWLLEESYEAYSRCDTFRVIEQLLVEKLLDECTQETAHTGKWQDILFVRRTKHWYEKGFDKLYAVLEAALSILEQKHSFQQVFAPKNGEEWMKQYTESVYKIDLHYRKMIYAYERINYMERFAQLIEQMTDWYEHRYLSKVAQWTDDFLEQQGKEKWPIPGMLQQQSFYQQLIHPFIEKTTERVFVIISDALRYEAGVELAERLQKRMNAEVELRSMQASLPSYTQLGMASLLPGRTFGYQGKTVLRDGMSTRGLDKREAVLQKREATAGAMNVTEFMASNQAEWIRGRRLIYLYHDRIDSVGDKQKSENYAYGAVEDTLRDLEGVVQKLVGTYSAVRIFITTDHGFLYQTRKVDAPNKMMAVSGDIIDGNRRFALGYGLSVPIGAKKVSLTYLGLEEEAAIALGTNRFQIQGGGLKFVHGGAMPQETVVPVIMYHQIRGLAKKKQEERVDVRVMNRERILTNYRFKVSFFQEQKISEERMLRHLRVAFYKDEVRISNETTLVFDLTGDTADRQLDVFFSLREHSVSVGEKCVLRMEDVTDSKTKLYREELFDVRIYDMLM